MSEVTNTVFNYVLAAIFIVGILLVLSGGSDWFDPRSAKDERRDRPAGLWWRSVGICRKAPWLVLLMLATSGLELLPRSNPSPKLAIASTTRPPNRQPPRRPVSKVNAYLVAATSGMLVAGEPFSTGNPWLAGALLLVGGWLLLRRKHRRQVWFAWGILSGCCILKAMVPFPDAAFNQPQTYGVSLLHFLVFAPPLTAFVAGLLIVSLREIVSGEPLKYGNLLRSGARVSVKWFPLHWALHGGIVLPIAVVLLFPGPSLGWSMIGVCFGMAILLLTAVVLRFTLYALVIDGGTLRDAMRRSHELWRRHTREVLGLLLPLGVIGAVCGWLAFAVHHYGETIHLPAVQYLSDWLRGSIWCVFMLLAELTCLQWYQLMTDRQQQAAPVAASPE